jgi:hypothetical protein
MDKFRNVLPNVRKALREAVRSSRDFLVSGSCELTVRTRDERVSFIIFLLL